MTDKLLREYRDSIVFDMDHLILHNSMSPNKVGLVMHPLMIAVKK
jgi:hypothetical protein